MIGRVAICTLLGLSYSHAATPLEARIEQAARAYRSCVLDAAVDLARGSSGSLQLVAEQAFLACSTEEQAIRAVFVAVGSPPEIAESAIVRAKLNLKNIITLRR